MPAIVPAVPVPVIVNPTCSGVNRWPPEGTPPVPTDYAADNQADRPGDHQARAGTENGAWAKHSTGTSTIIFKMADQPRHKSMDTLRGYIRDAEIFKRHCRRTASALHGPWPRLIARSGATISRRYSALWGGATLLVFGSSLETATISRGASPWPPRRSRHCRHALALSTARRSSPTRTDLRCSTNPRPLDGAKVRWLP